MTNKNATFVFRAQSEQDTRRLGAALAQALPEGANVALIGTLGSGKTRLVQALAAALGVPEDRVTSPTFVLIHEYRGRRPIYHIDAYRIRDVDEFAELGADELFESAALVAIEWADRVQEALPPDRLEIRIESTGEEAREFTASTPSERLEGAIALLASIMGQGE